MSYDNPLIEAFEVSYSWKLREASCTRSRARRPLSLSVPGGQQLGESSADAVRKLSPRVRRARLNAIWNQILEKHQK
ncbi:MAG: hypothetical protein DMG30_01900 [Acidobacteria bacterium]|nr:MAG: hypothetical protein DMG30_01900 [Acidobacteriota bacterium]